MQNSTRSEILLKLEILSKKRPDILPEVNYDYSTDNLKACLEQCIEEINGKSKVDTMKFLMDMFGLVSGNEAMLSLLKMVNAMDEQQYKALLPMLYLLIENVCVKYLAIDITGFALEQMKNRDQFINELKKNNSYPFIVCILFTVLNDAFIFWNKKTSSTILNTPPEVFKLFEKYSNQPSDKWLSDELLKIGKIPQSNFTNEIMKMWDEFGLVGIIKFMHDNPDKSREILNKVLPADEVESFIKHLKAMSTSNIEKLITHLASKSSVNKNDCDVNKCNDCDEKLKEKLKLIAHFYPDMIYVENEKLDAMKSRYDIYVKALKELAMKNNADRVVMIRILLQKNKDISSNECNEEAFLKILN